MEVFLETKHIPLTEGFLAKHGLEMDRWDGVVSLVDEDYSVPYEGGVTIVYRKVVTSFWVDKDEVTFMFNTTQKSRFLKEKHLKTKKPEKWFDLIEEIATILAREVGIPKITVLTGRKDKAFLLSKGFTLASNKFYYKNV